MNISNLKIAITEDEAFTALNMKRKLEKMGYKVTGIFACGTKILEHLTTETPDVVLMDIALEGRLDGIETAEIIQQKYEIPIVFITAFSDAKTFERVKNNYSYGYITKPLNFSKMSYVIELAYSKHKMDMEIKHSELRYHNLFDKMFNGMCVFEFDQESNMYIVVESNLALSRMIGENIKLIKQKKLDDIFPESFDYLKEILNETLKTGQPKLFERYFPELEKYLSINIFLNSKNHVAFLVEDITNKKDYQDSLYLASLGRISTAITHEINQPLQSIKVLADSIVYLHDKGEKLSYDEVLTDFREVSDRVVRIEKIINNIRNLQKKPDNNNFTRIDINKSILNGVGAYCKQLNSLQIELQIELLKSSSVIVASDVIIEQIISNLMNNAVVALTTISSKVKKHIKIMTVIDEESLILIFSDNGIGIKEEDSHTIFQPHITKGNSEENMGMGLYIVKCLMKNMNGSIHYNNRNISGAEFILKFPNVN